MSQEPGVVFPCAHKEIYSHIYCNLHIYYKNNVRMMEDYLTNEIILGKIYLIRDQKVMLDRDLAELFDIKAFVYVSK